jgi:cation:H+ antiporter
MLYYFILVFAGLTLLTFGAEGLVRSGSSLALRLGVTPLVVGLTIVAFGTGSPELVVAIQSAVYGNSAIALGSVVGSNISNTALILGAAALVYPIKARTQVVRREVPLMIVVTALLWVLIYDGELGKFDGILLFAGSLVYTFLVYFLARRNKSTEVAEEFAEAVDRPTSSKWLDILILLGGLSLLILGANLLVYGAVGIAGILEIPEVVIGLTIIAVGTSLPEMATSIVASYRKEADLALGNAIGSNIINILCVLGITAIISPISVEGIRTLDMAVMLGSAILLWILLGVRFLLDRLEGGILLLVYVIYIYTLIQ